MTTQQRIERIAWNVANLLADQYQNSRPVSLAGEMPKPVAIIIAALTAFAEEQEKDVERMNWLEEWAKKSPTGISFDRVKACEGDPAGFRFMRRFYIGLPYKSIRTAIDFEMNYETPSTGEKPE